MRIYFYPECNFNINKASVYDCGSLAEWFDSQHKNPDDYEIVGKDGEYHDSDYNGEVCAVYPKIMGGKKKGKNILTAVVGLALVLASGGALGALSGALHMTGTMVHTLGAGLLLSGGGALLMGKMKMPSMDIGSESDTKQSYQWNVGNLSTSRGVKGVTFGSDVIPEGELLAYRTYGTNSIQKIVERIYSNQYRNATKAEYDATDPSHRLAYFNYKKGVDYTYKVQKYTNSIKYSNEDDSSYLEVLIGAGEGELDEITDIKINDISLADLDMTENVDYAVRLGSNTQTALKQTNLDSQVGYSSIGQTVPQKLNNSVTPLLITTPEACDSCEIAFQTNGWYLYDTGSGAKNNAYIKLKIGYRTSGSSGDYTYLTKTISEIDNKYPIKSESAFYFKVAIKFPSNGTYQISIENDSAELNYTKGLLTQAEYQGSALPDRAALNLSCDNIACYDNKEQTYPNTALIWLRIPASQTLNGSMPKITWKQTRANIYAYNGSSYVTKPANNLAWAIYDIIAQVRKDGNTYHNEGEDVNNIDFDKFVAFATFCDSIGATGNWFLNKLDTSWSNAMSVATSCRAFIGLKNGKVCPYWDAPTEMTQIFTVGNYENMSGAITAKKDRAKAIEATFNNEEEKFDSRTVRVEIDNDHSAEAVSMTFVGLSNPVNVSKAAHYILRRNKYLVQSIKFTADIDSIVCELNDVIGIQCDLTEYGVGGRIFKVENNVISLDAPVTLESGKTYALLVRHTDGTLERNTPVETNGTFTQLTFNSSWSKPVLKGDVYSFGIANSEVRKYRVTGITRTNDLKAQIEAIEYNENVYDELAVAPYTYTNPNAGINNVTTTYTPEAVELAWDANNNTSYVNVYVDGVFYGRYKNGATIPNINSEQLVEMYPVNENGEEDTAVVRTISNNLPTPSTPPVPIVHSTTTGCVAEFDGIPKNENIVWLVIKEGETELGRTPIMGEYMTVSIQLTSGTHTLTAYFLNQYNKTSQGRTFTGVPLGDMVANDISAAALKLPTGSILRLSAKNCTTASIAEDKGVKDCSGRGNHGRAYGGVAVVQDAEIGDCFSFDGANDYLLINNSNLISLINTLNSLTMKCKVKFASDSDVQYVFSVAFSSNVMAGICLENKKIKAVARRITSDSLTVIASESDIEVNKSYDVVLTADFESGKLSLFVGAVLDAESEALTTGTITGVDNIFVGCVRETYYSNCSVSDVRIYPRVLSNSEIKTTYMFPDDVTFGQLTADLIGANVIKASNLILTDKVITTVAQIDQAVVNNLNVTGNATFQAGLNGIQVGGRNLIRNTSTEKTFNTASTVNHDYVVTSYAASNVKATDDLTISFEAKASEARWIDFYWNDGTSSYTTGFHANSQLSTSYQKFSYTLKSNRNLDSNYVLRFRQKASESGSAAGGPTIYIKNLIVEMGTRATSWTPAPEDVDADIASGDSSTLTSAQADATTKANAVKNGLGTNGYTAIHGGNIMTDTITANAIAANAITAEKINVSMPFPAVPSFKLLFTKFSAGLLTDGAYLPNSGEYNVMFKVVNGAWTSSADATYGRLIQINKDKGQINSVGNTTIGANWTFACRLDYDLGNSANSIIFASWPTQNATSGNNGIVIFINKANSNHLTVTLTNSSGTASNYDSGIAISNKTNTFICVRQSGTNLYITVNTTNKTLTCIAHTAQNSYYHFGNQGLASRGTNYRGFYWIGMWLGRALSADEVAMLYKFRDDGSSGLITADCIATDAIRGRDASGGGDGSYTTQGIVMNLSGKGWLSTQKCSISSSGVIKAKDVDLTGKITATSGSIGGFLLQNGMLLGAGSDTSSNFMMLDYSTSSYSYDSQFNCGNILLEYWTTSSNTKYINQRTELKSDMIRMRSFSNGQQTSQSAISSSCITVNAGGSNTAEALLVTGKVVVNGSVVHGSDENIKTEIKDVSTLEKLKKIRIKSWKYDEEKINQKEYTKELEQYSKGDLEEKPVLRIVKSDYLKEAPTHIGAMAGEFNEAFGTSNNSKDFISYTDEIGVALRSIQELAEIVDSQKAEIAELKALLKTEKNNKESNYYGVETTLLSNQQDEKSEIIDHFNDLVKEPTNENELIEPSFDELLKTGENQQEEQK